MIGDKSAILDIAKAMAEHAAVKQSTATQNLAQANTPGYRAREVQDLAEAYANGELPKVEIDRDAPLKPNGNSVSLEGQIMEMAEAKGQHDMALGLWDKTLAMFHEALGGRR